MSVKVRKHAHTTNTKKSGFFFSWIIWFNFCFGFEQKVEIKVDINCEKCRYDIMQTVTELVGMIPKNKKTCY